jgi:hypothetical protein
VIPTVSHLPAWNTMAMFVVQPGKSFHSVQVCGHSCCLGDAASTVCVWGGGGGGCSRCREGVVCNWHWYGSGPRQSNGADNAACFGLQPSPCSSSEVQSIL